jgi:hypothetical protein
VEPELSIGAVSERTGVAHSALRFYEAQGLIHSSRSDGGQRRYPRDILRRVARFDVYLKELDVNLVTRMFDRQSIIHSRKRWEEVGGAEQHKLRPISTGPYQLVDWKVGVGTEWVKHPQYWRGEPMMDRVNVRVITENRARLAALQTGEVQVAWLQAEQVLEAQKDPNIKVWSVSGVGWDGWAWAGCTSRAATPTSTARPWVGCFRRATTEKR